jgi:hypothetical protein
MGNAPESYLIRIYRRDPQDPRRIAGVVELIEQERTEHFKSAGELMRILAIHDSGSEVSKR